MVVDTLTLAVKPLLIKPYRRQQNRWHLRWHVDIWDDRDNKIVSTDTIESFWAVLKRSIKCFYHYINITAALNLSPALEEHAERQLSEFIFRDTLKKLIYAVYLILWFPMRKDD